ncbi:MAG: response regulator transcription factor [Polyangiaceae bacterium]|nr:response regulator transcription factor [Polyangiaceae bacterium]NUQ76766.1 response regulator transcription factor [Polyangiaceae bacterium]
MSIEPRTPAGSPRKVLVVEDDPSIAMGLELNLMAEGYAVTTASDGEEGLRLARGGTIDLIILDVMLPRINGFEVVRLLRSEGHHVPVIMLSARGAEMDKVMGLELGAEDYITKPFGLAEFLARVRAVFRREGRGGRDTVKTVLSAGPLAINRGTREVFRQGQSIDLTGTEFDILACLVEAEGRVLSREEIQAKVWGPSHHGTPRTIDNFILQLRAKIEPDPGTPRHILTVRGRGYRFAP